ncbi:N-acetyltransferase GCN5 [Aliidongia dinghuensis]|uniref:N-acetyltransferase GCN5 n=1 Tax=Aliidongia dinghuensis TaxID=1867774 RepID=A0A8J3E3D3_9PROT|nr:GNAT family N-acetyltransferase [Aliidongia dinghuensis]GGF29381.1 N-acetyltransferase GCN5 [Aliidongia dinghuensis]
MAGPVRLVAVAPDDARATAPCLPVLRVLRPHLGADEAVLAQLARQAAEGYRLLAAVDSEDKVLALAGWRFQENTVYGRFLYVDDLVTLPDRRGEGLGECLIEALAAQARAAGCRRLALDSGVTNSAAHRFYFRQRLTVGAFRFSLPLD